MAISSEMAKNAILTDNLSGVELHFMPGHSGIELTEMVDQTAKRAVDIAVPCCIPWPLEDASKNCY